MVNVNRPIIADFVVMIRTKLSQTPTSDTMHSTYIIESFVRNYGAFNKINNVHLSIKQFQVDLSQFIWKTCNFARDFTSLN